MRILEPIESFGIKEQNGVYIKQPLLYKDLSFPDISK